MIHPDRLPTLDLRFTIYLLRSSLSQYLVEYSSVGADSRSTGSSVVVVCMTVMTLISVHFLAQCSIELVEPVSPEELDSKSRDERFESLWLSGWVTLWWRRCGIEDS